jgi:FkbM family methyltransferase
MEIATLCIQNKIAYQELFYFNIATKSILPFVGLYSDLTVSQDGEEVYLKSKFANREKGLYVDIGANHPIRFSNTWWAYIKGWRGINIEPNVNNFKLLESIRNEDININCGIANEEGYLDYYEFQESALNTFVYEEIEEKIKNQIINIHKVPVRQLSDILKENNVHQIDYIDIDVEGMEMEVLQSINWDDVSIEVLLIEQRRMSLENVIKSDICKFLYNKGYIPQNKYNRTVIYEKSM